MEHGVGANQSVKVSIIFFFVCHANYYYYALLMLGYFLHLAACASLLDPINGEVNQLGTTFGSRAVYSCNTGFVMDGTSVRFCSFDGTWTSNPPTCCKCIL